MTQVELQQIRDFETRVRGLMLEYCKLQKENEQLKEIIEQGEEEIKQLKSEVRNSKNDYQTLKMAKLLEVTDGDVARARQRITNLVRQVNHCINMLDDVEMKDKRQETKDERGETKEERKKTRDKKREIGQMTFSFD